MGIRQNIALVAGFFERLFFSQYAQNVEDDEESIFTHKVFIRTI